VTERMRKIVLEWGRLATAIGAMTAVASAVLSMVAVLLWSAFGEAIVKNAGVATADEMQSVKDKVDDLLRRVVVLARPDQISHYRDLPQSVEAECFAGAMCAVTVFVERDSRALDCKLIPERTQFLLAQNNLTYAVPAARQGTAINVGSSPRALEPSFRVPRGVHPGPVRVVLVSHYEGCLWQTDGEPPATQESPLFTIQIGSRSEDAAP